MMDRAELRASLLAVGPLLPLLIYSGEVLDGQKRAELCAELGLVPGVRTVYTREDAARALWVLHPDRAVVFARRSPSVHVPSLTEISKMLGVSFGAVALAAGVVDRRAPRRTEGHDGRLLVHFWADPAFKHWATLAAKAGNMTLSQGIRVAVWEWVQRTLPRAATEGQRRGPAKALVRRPKRVPAGQ